MVRDGEIERAGRWLSFIQGVLWSEHKFSIDDMEVVAVSEKDHNRGEDSFTNGELAISPEERECRRLAVEAIEAISRAQRECLDSEE